MNFIKEVSEKKFILFIIVISLVTGSISIILNNNNKVSPDGIAYLNYAYNLVNYGTFSWISEDPEEENYFREPGYPYFLAGILSINSWFSEVKFIEEDDYNREQGTINIDIKYLYFIRLAHVALLIISCIIFYKYLLFFVNISKARSSLLLLSVFYPYFVYSVNIIREPLQCFLFISYCYFIMHYYLHGSIKTLIVSSFLAGLGVLTFQVMVVFLPVSLLFIYLREKKKKFSIIINLVLFLLIFFMTLTPWLSKVYKYYPDLRILKSAGSNLTHESCNYIGALRYAYRNGILTEEELRQNEIDNWYRLSSKQVFNRSFSGNYKQQADSLRSLVSKQNKSYFVRFRKNTRYFYLSWFKHSWSPLALKEIMSNKQYFHLIPYGFSIILSLLGLFGSVLILKKNYIIFLIPFFVYLLLSIEVVGSESRRSLLLIPWIVFFATYALIYLCTKTKKMVAKTNE